MEEVPLLKLKHAETELKFHKERIAVIVREIAEDLSPEILEECGPEGKATFLRQNERWKGEKLIYDSLNLSFQKIFSYRYEFVPAPYWCELVALPHSLTYGTENAHKYLASL